MEEIEGPTFSVRPIHTPGHTYGSICLKYGHHLFSGDHVLPSISPNVGGGDMRRHGMLISFLDSLRETIKLAGKIDTVYPGHGEPFGHLVQRCNWLIDHHHKRLGQIAEILQREGRSSTFEVATGLWGELRDYHVVLGCAEAQSHLEYLVDEGRVIRDENHYALA